MFTPIHRLLLNKRNFDKKCTKDKSVFFIKNSFIILESLIYMIQHYIFFKKLFSYINKNYGRHMCLNEV